MPGNRGAAPVHDVSPAVKADGDGPAFVLSDTHNHDGRHGSASADTDSRERDFIELVSRRPSFMENLADSRESQFRVQNTGEFERYFVCGSPRRKSETEDADGKQ